MVGHNSRQLLAVTLRFPGPGDAEARTVHRGLLERGVLGGLVLADAVPDDPSVAEGLLVCATEMTTSEEIARFASALAELTGARGRQMAEATRYFHDLGIEVMREGRVLFINELNRMPESVQNVLLPALDERLLQLMTGRVISQVFPKIEYRPARPLLEFLGGTEAAEAFGRIGFVR